jgi:hypothetical protein
LRLYYVNVGGFDWRFLICGLIPQTKKKNSMEIGSSANIRGEDNMKRKRKRKKKYYKKEDKREGESACWSIL